MNKSQYCPGFYESIGGGVAGQAKAYPVTSNQKLMDDIYAKEDSAFSAPSRPGALEYATDALTRVAEGWMATVENEVIRAREMGQREGREETQGKMQLRIIQLENTVNRYRAFIADINSIY